MNTTYIVDYGVGNLYSLSSSLSEIGADPVISSDPAAIKQADRLILPGVGAFPDAAEKLKQSGMWEAVVDFVDRGRALLGICLGMQLLFDESVEFGSHSGLGLIPGNVVPLDKYVTPDKKIPHMGWNSLKLIGDSPIYRYIEDGDHVYFVHSYFAKCPHQYLTATAEYGFEVTASVQRGNVYGTQFHPEKSGTVGLNILKAFCEL